MIVNIAVIPHKQQRYDTCGDWMFDEHGDLTILISAMGDWRSEMLVAIHELVEVILCKHDGVTQEAVDTFDQDHPECMEPGDEPTAPYRDQHCFATSVERMVCAAMKMPWSEHDQRVMNLSGDVTKDGM